MPPSIPILTAPTAAGKSALALSLATEFPIEIIAADAFTVYHGLDIGTAKPSAQEQAAVPHHLLDVVDVTQDFDVAQYLALAEQAIADVQGRGHIPLIVGGTGFYLSALVKGLPLTPRADRDLQRLIESELEEQGLDALLAEIERVNPAEAARMERNPRRIVRALEVYRRTGRFPGEFGYSVPKFQYQAFAFAPEMPVLEARIRQRTGEMLAKGWPAEAQWLAAQVSPTLTPRPTVWQTLGYAEALALAEGTLTTAEAAERIALATRQYAKRQLTMIKGTLGARILDRVQAEAELRVYLRAAIPHGKTRWGLD